MAIDQEDYSDLDAILSDLLELLGGFNGIRELMDCGDYLAELQLDLSREGYNYIGSESAGTYLDNLWKAGYGLRDLLREMKADVAKVLSGKE